MGLVGLLLRILSGERYRKSTPAERRWGGGFFLFMPVFIFVGVHLAHKHIERANSVGVWFYMMVYLLIWSAFLFVWARYVPAMVSLMLGIITWIITIWASFTGRLG
jgi:hypothetical protein